MLCKCGCGTDRPAIDKRGRERAYVNGHWRRKPLADRLWAKVDKHGECWIWTGAINKCGYGHMASGVRGRTMLAHRASWLVTYGEITDGLGVLHRCDNPRCVRPDHLFLGTQAVNVQDSINKRRWRPWWKKEVA